MRGVARFAATLKAQYLLVNPIVDVFVVEYRSSDVTVDLGASHESAHFPHPM
jgi:hypothetical protein